MASLFFHIWPFLQDAGNAYRITLPAETSDIGIVGNVRRDYSSFPVSEDLVEVPIITNRVSFPSVVWINGIDYKLDKQKNSLIFASDPFENELISRRDVFNSDGEIVDGELGLWLFHAKTDNEYIWRHWGYALGIKHPSSHSYKKLINAIYDGLLLGGTAEIFKQLLFAVADLETVQNAEETVEQIFKDNNRLIVATDKQIYKFNERASSIVSVGDIVRPGDSLANVVEIYEFNKGVVPDTLEAVSVGAEFFGANYQSNLAFYNREVEVVVEENVNGKTKLSFELGGLPEDVALFWNDVHARGVAADQTIANLLDIRENPTTEPSAASLPTTINPLEFLVKNILRNNGFLVRVHADKLGPEALPLTALKSLHRLILPHTAMILAIELTANMAVQYFDQPGDENTPGSEGTAETYSAADTTTFEADPDHAGLPINELLVDACS